MPVIIYIGEDSNVAKAAGEGSIGIMSENKAHWENYASKNSGHRDNHDRPWKNVYEPKTGGDYSDK